MDVCVGDISPSSPSSPSLLSPFPPPLPLSPLLSDGLGEDFLFNLEYSLVFQ